MGVLKNDISKTVIESIINYIPFPAVLVNRFSRIVCYNDSFHNYYELSESVIGKNIVSIEKETRIPNVIDNNVVEIEWDQKFSNGKIGKVNRIPLCDETGDISYCLAFIYDEESENSEASKENRILKNVLDYYKEKLRIESISSYSMEKIYGDSEKVDRMKKAIKNYTKKSSNLLIYGEKGSGKEFVSRVVHHSSVRKENPYLKIDCRDNLKLKDSLRNFSVVDDITKVIFSDMRLISGGTIFFKNIHFLDEENQVLLNRFIEKIKSYNHYNNQISLDLRLFFSTTPKIHELLKFGRFSRELYDNINILKINIPKIQERSENFRNVILELINENIDFYVKDFEIDDEYISCLEKHKFVNNIKELKWIVTHSLEGLDGNSLTKEDLPKWVNRHDELTCIGSLKEEVEKLEKSLIEKCLKETRNNKQKTSKILKISRSTLYEKIEKYNINVGM